MSCAVCSRRIGEHDRHWIIAADLRVICYPCGPGGTVKNCTATLNHLLVFPGCGVEWHDIHNHRAIYSDSAADTRLWLASSPRRAQFVGSLGIMADRAGAR